MDDKTALVARGRLADARRWFTQRGWEVLPQGIRGQRILQWGADHAWLASSDNPKRSVRRWCRRWAPWLEPSKIDELVASTETSNKSWNHDQCATVLEITVRDRTALGLRFIGADDDPDYEQRRAAKKAKNAAANRRWRAAHSTGRKRGRPKLEVPAWKAAGYKSKRTYQRHKALGIVTAQSGTKNTRCDLSKNRTHHGIKVPSPTRPGIDLTSINFDRFGIIAVRIMSGQNVISAWSSAPR